MKRVMLTILISAIAGTASAASAVDAPFAKNRCILYGEGCPEAKESLPEKIDHLKREVAKGNAVYTDAELKRLRAKLEEAERLLDWLLYHPGN